MAARFVGAALTAGVLVLGGCAVTIDTDELEQQIRDKLSSRTGATLLSVDCPDDVTPEAGATFECTATADDGSVATITVTQRDDEGNVHWVVTSVE